MKCRSKLTVIAASLMLAASAQALEAKLSKADLPLLAPEVQHTTTSKRVTSRLTRSHYKHFNLNDEFSQAMFNRYVEMLDYNKNIFTQSDINSFVEWSVQLDDQLKSGSNKIAFKLYNLANEKRFERFSYALTLLDEEIKFDVDESMMVDRSDAEWYQTQSEVNELWRKRVKYDALNLKLTGKD